MDHIGQLSQWDAGATDGLVCKGYTGVGTDGEYLYYSPFHNGSAHHGIVLRQKIFSIFKDAGTWEAYDAGSVDGLNSKGFYGNPIFDGRFMYFCPFNNGSTSGVVLRFDTTKPFKSVSSWEAYNAGSVDSLTTRGFHGAVFDGQFIYFVPYNNGAYNGIVLRLDTTKPFKSSGSWEAYDFGGLASGAAKSYLGAVVLGNFIYFSPYFNSTANSQIVRYDITKPFKSSTSWEAFNAITVAANCKSFGTPCTDGRFVYFPNATYNLILRYDSMLPFTSLASYTAFNILDLSDDEYSRHNACCVQGKYVVFAPSMYTIRVYDTDSPFSDPGSWVEKDVYSAEDLERYGFIGTYSDPNYIYFAPCTPPGGTIYHGQVLRGRIKPCPNQIFPTPGEENFHDYIKDDYNWSTGYLSISASRVTAVAIEPLSSSLLYQDYGKDCFDGFVINFDIKFTSATSASTDWDDGYMCLFSLANRHSSFNPYYFSTLTDPCVIFEAHWASPPGSPSQVRITLCKESTSGSSYIISIGTIYYCTISRTAGSGTVTLRIYSDAARTTLLSTLTETGFSTTKKWRFIYAMRGTDSTGEWDATYFLENLEVITYS